MDSDCAESLPFENRAAAGAALARRLLGIHWHAPPIVLALPCGGVPVAKAVASALQLPLDVLVVRKVPHPHNPEYAIGAVAAEQRVEVERRESRYRPGRSPLSLAGKTAILVDDGLATGATMRAALAAARAMGAAYLVAAVPVGSREAVDLLAGHADLVICMYCPEPFQSVGFHYANFNQLHDADVRAALAA